MESSFPVKERMAGEKWGDDKEGRNRFAEAIGTDDDLAYPSALRAFWSEERAIHDGISARVP